MTQVMQGVSHPDLEKEKGWLFVSL